MRAAPARIAVLAAIAAGCAAIPAKPPPLTFAEAGLARPAQGSTLKRPRTRLDGATDALLEAIERETGERPVFDPDREEAPDLDAGERRAARKHANGWVFERNNLAHELMIAIDGGGATVGSVKRARAALLWDVLLGARWTAVDAKIVNDALDRAEAALPKPPQPAGSIEVWASTSLSWPVAPVHVTSRFGLRDDPLGEGTRRHTGIDLQAAEGQNVTCAAAGEVVFAGNRGGYGLHVEVRHADGRLTRYAHLSECEVRPGDRVNAGALLGRAGRSGRATGPHLHFEVWKDGLPLDPEEELDDAGPRKPAPQAARRASLYE